MSRAERNALSAGTQVMLRSAHILNSPSPATWRSSHYGKSFHLWCALLSMASHPAPLTTRLPLQLCLPGFLTESSFLQHSLEMTVYLHGLPAFLSSSSGRHSDPDRSLSSSQLSADKTARNSSSFLRPSLLAHETGLTPCPTPSGLADSRAPIASRRQDQIMGKHHTPGTQVIQFAGNGSYPREMGRQRPWRSFTLIMWASLTDRLGKWHLIW